MDNIFLQFIKQILVVSYSIYGEKLNSLKLYSHGRRLLKYVILDSSLKYSDGNTRQRFTRLNCTRYPLCNHSLTVCNSDRIAISFTSSFTFWTCIVSSICDNICVVLQTIWHDVQTFSLCNSPGDKDIALETPIWIVSISILNILTCFSVSLYSTTRNDSVPQEGW